MSTIPDFTDAERWTTQTTVDERWGKATVELHAADVEIRLDPGDTAPTDCPALFWHADDCNFVLMKTGQNRFRCQFFYDKDLQQIGTGITEYDNIVDCAVALLQTQADDKRMRSAGS